MTLCGNITATAFWLLLMMVRVIGVVVASLVATTVLGQTAGFSIGVDGEHFAGDPQTPAAPRKTDVALEKLDIAVTFDGLDVAPMLNVSTADRRVGYAAGGTIGFVMTSNYPSWIARAEIVIADADAGPGHPVAVLPVGPDGRASWTMPADGGGRYSYVLKVYDVQGRSDETEPAALVRTAFGDAPAAPPAATGWGENRTARRSIPVYGGAVTVHGTNARPGAGVVAFGERVPVDADGHFIIQRLLPPGDHVVDVTVGGPGGGTFSRPVNIPQNEWFYVGMADLTVGRMFGAGEVVAADPGEFDGVYAKGRLAFYLKGKIKGSYLLTAAADTGEGGLDELFTGLMSKDSRALLKRIDPNQFYPVYGDDSTLVEDAPTSGKFYVRLARGESHVMWGNFRATIGGTELLATSRTLYGASAVVKSEEVTAAGANRVAVTAYAAKGGTLAQRDVLRGTGGSAYFLKRQDISAGSETVTIEAQDATTGIVLSRRPLVNGKDYELDYLQGVIVLAQPLNATMASEGGIWTTASGDAVVNLVVQYEYTPALDAADGLVSGGRAEAWLSDHLMVGVTALGDDGDTTGHHLAGADLRLLLTRNSFLSAEMAQSDGTGAGQWLSTDGGLTYVNEVAPGTGRRPMAYRVAGQADLADLTGGSVQGNVAAYVEQVERGFSSPSQQALTDRLVWGATARVNVGEDGVVVSSVESRADGDGARRQQAEVRFSNALEPNWRVEVGMRGVSLRTPAGSSAQNGERIDAGVQVTYQPTDELTLYGFGQGTLWKSPAIARSDRAGVGGAFRLTETIGVNGQASYGTTGMGALAAMTIDPTPDEHSYIGYRLNPLGEATPFYGQPAEGQSGVVVGTRRRYGDAMTAFLERNLGLGSEQRTLTTTYGVTLTPDTRWTVSGNVESGRIDDPNGSDFDRNAVSLGVAYAKDDDLAGHLRGEVRLEDSSDTTRNRQHVLLDAGLQVRTSEDWRLLADVDGVVSRSDQSAILDGDFVEARLGYAYRPADNDRLNALFRYVFLYDLPGPDQVNAAGQARGPWQRSNVLSADVSYDLTQRLTLGAKYGFRFGEVASDRTTGAFVRSSAHLGILRADMKVLDNWGLLLEGGALYAPESSTVQLGALAAISYDISPNLRLGAGYNFGSYSDDLTDLTQDDHGVFVNVLSKF